MIMRRTIYRPMLLVALACRSAPVPAPVPAAPPPSLPSVSDVSPWPATLRQAQQAAESGDYSAADRLLSAFGISHRNSAEGREADFFRAVESHSVNQEASSKFAKVNLHPKLPKAGK